MVYKVCLYSIPFYYYIARGYLSFSKGKSVFAVKNYNELRVWFSIVREVNEINLTFVTTAYNQKGKLIPELG